MLPKSVYWQEGGEGDRGKEGAGLIRNPVAVITGWGGDEPHTSEVLAAGKQKKGRKFPGKKGRSARPECEHWRGSCGCSVSGASAPVDPRPRAESPRHPHPRHPGPLALLSFYFILFSLLQHFCPGMESGAAISGLCSAAGIEDDGGWTRDLSLSPSPPPQGRTPGSRTGWPWAPPSPGDPLPHSPPGTPLPLLIARSTFCHELTDAGAGRRNSFRFLLPGCELYLAHSPVSQALLGHVFIFPAACTESGARQLVGLGSRD